MQELKTALELKKRELESLSLKHELSPYLQFFTVVMPILLGCALLICAFACALADESSQGSGSNYSGAVAFLLGGVVSLGVGFQMKRKGEAGDENWKKTKQGLQDSIQTLEKKIIEAAELGEVEKELAALSPARFACKTTDELRTLRDSRRALIGRVMGKEYAPSDPPSRRLPPSTPDRVIGYIPNVTPPAGILVEDEEDLLRLWCLETAKLFNENPHEAEKFATRDSVSFANWLVCSRRAVICRISQCSLMIICEVPKPELPKQFLDRLTECGVKAATQVKWRSKIRRYEFDEEAGDENSVAEKSMLASDVIAGLPL